MSLAHYTAPAATGATPLTRELDALFESLESNTLLEQIRPYGRGRTGYGPKTMWRCTLLGFVLGIPADAAIIRYLEDNPTLAAAVGGIPSPWAFSRFRKRLTGNLEALETCSAGVVDRLKAILPGLGKVVAVDASDVHAWSNRHKPSDGDAKFGAKQKDGGKYFWYGYKLHVAVCADTEIPLAATVTPGNTYDGHQLGPVLMKAADSHAWFKPELEAVLADKGYDAKACRDFVRYYLDAEPVIDSREKGKKRRLRRLNADPCEAQLVQTASGERYMCQRRPWKRDCPNFGICPITSKYVDEGSQAAMFTDNEAPKSKMPKLYNKRTSVERVFSRLKSHRKLDGLRVRGMAKATVHLLLAVLVMQGVALAVPERLRSLVRAA